MAKIILFLVLFGSNLAFSQEVMVEKGRYGVKVDSTWILQPRFDSISEFSVKGTLYFWVRESGYEGVYTSDGEFAIPYDYEKVGIVGGSGENWKIEVPSGEIGRAPLFVVLMGEVGFRHMINNYITPSLIDYSYENLIAIQTAILNKERKVSFTVDGQKVWFDLKKGLKL